MPDKMITLAEAFRVILRAAYSKRPALADEIQSYDYFRYAPIARDSGLRDPEAQAAFDAIGAFKNAIAGQRLSITVAVLL